MINVSNAFKQGLENGEKVWIETDITFSDGTSKHLKNEIMNGNNSFSDCAESSSFPIGCVICKSITLELDNTSDQWKDYYFYMAKVHAYLKMQIDASTVETIDKGVYTITTPEQYGETLNFTALDDMYKVNAAYTSNLTLPQSVETLVRDACETLGIPFGGTMQHGNLIISEIPENMTFRQLFGWAAMLETANARLDNRGYLQFIRWDLDATPSIELKDYINMPTVSSDDIVITGINIISGDNSETYGTSGYILSMENNLVGEADLATVAAQIGDSIIGAKFRNLQGDMAFNPLLEFGDVAYTYDRNLNQYVTPLTDVSYAVNGKTSVKTQADDPIRGMSKFVSDGTKAIVEARRLAKKEQSAREEAVKKLEETLKNSSGLYETSVTQEDGSTITYLHDKPTLAESKNVIKFTAEAIGVSNDGGNTYPYGFFLTGDLIAKILYAHGINADYIDTGALIVRDIDGNIIFQVDMDTNTVYMNPDILIIGNQTLTEKLTAMDNGIAEAKNMTMQLTNDYQSITTDSDGNIPGAFPTVETTAQVMYGNDNVTEDCTYSISKSSNVTGSWNSSTYTYTVTGLSVDDGWVDIKATYLQTLSITRRFTIAKLKAGKNGINGLDGLQGEKGEQGIPGKDGKDGVNGVDGKTSYFHIKYSSVANPTSSSQITESPSTYIGTYVDYEPNDSTDPRKYTWSKFEGSDGKDGIPGTNGTDGKTYYLHIAYANSADGRTGFSVSDGTNKLYIGQYTDTTKEDSTDPTKYSWTKIKGEQGAAGRTYFFRSNADVLLMGADKKITPASLIVDSFYRDGNGEIAQSQKGWWKLEKSTDNGATWAILTVSQTAALDRLKINVNGLSLKAHDMLKVSLYFDQAKTKLADYQTYSVAVDVAALTQEQIVDILSNSGTWKGLYYLNKHLYISFDAAKGGTLVLGGKNDGNGLMKIYDSSGSLILTVGQNGIETRATTLTDKNAKGKIAFNKKGLTFTEDTAGGGTGTDEDLHLEKSIISFDSLANIIGELDKLTVRKNAKIEGKLLFYDYENQAKRESGSSEAVTRQPVASVAADTNRVAFLSSDYHKNGYGAGTEHGSYRLGIKAQWGGSSYETHYIYSNLAVSDIRLKENIESSETDALETVNRMKVRQFDWKERMGGWHQDIGFVADELEEIDPNLALGGGYDENGEMDIKQINSPYLLNYAIKAIQELSAKVEAQEKCIKELERRLQ